MITARIAEFIADTNIASVPYEVREHAKVGLLDWLGVLLAGKNEEAVQKLSRYAELLGGNTQATLLGSGQKTNLTLAALINGAASHALDFDDSLTQFHGHPSVTILPALMALAEHLEKSGEELLTAYIIAVETGAVVGLCAGYEHYRAGWHGTSTIGHLAAAAGCAKLLSLSKRQTIYALGIAGTQASGLRGVFGTMCKPFHAGKAARAGLEAALLAGSDFDSAKDILEGNAGFFSTMHGQENDNAILSIGEAWYIRNLVYKYHASCLETHSQIEAALQIKDENELNIAEIELILIKAPLICVEVAGKTEIRTGLEGKFSIAYCVANALLRDDTGRRAYTDHLVQDPEIKELMRKIKIIADPDLEPMGTSMEIRTISGLTFQGNYDVLKHHPSLEEKREKVMRKFHTLCDPITGSQKNEELIRAVFAVEAFKNIRDFAELI